MSTDVATFVKDHVYGQASPHFTHPRERLQLATLLVLMATTTGRPGDITISEGYGDKPFCVCWQDVIFKILKTDTVSTHTNKHQLRLLCLLTLQFCKGAKNSADDRDVVLWREMSMPSVLDPLDLLVALTLENDAVEAPLLPNFENLRMDFAKVGESISLTMQEEKRDIPVLRSIINRDGVYTVNPIIGLKERAAQTNFRRCKELSLHRRRRIT